MLLLTVANLNPPGISEYDVAAAQRTLHQRVQHTAVDSVRDYTANCPAAADGTPNKNNRCKREFRRISKELIQLQANHPELRDPLQVAQERLDKARELVTAADRRLKSLPDLAVFDQAMSAAKAAAIVTLAEATAAKDAAAVARKDADNKATAAKGNSTPAASAEAEKADALAVATELVAQDRARTAAESAEKAASAVSLHATQKRRQDAATNAHQSAVTAVQKAERAKSSAETAIASTKAAETAARTSAAATAAATAAEKAAKKAAKKAADTAPETKAAQAARSAAETARHQAADAAETARQDTQNAQEDAIAADEALATAHTAAEQAKATDVVVEDKAVAPEVAAAAAEAAAAKAKAEQAEAMYRDLASGKFIENGVTGGLALTLQTPFVGDRATVQQSTAVTTTLTPYLLLIPGYWRQTPETNRFCASHWSTDIIRAQESADQMARQRATPVTNTLINYIQAGLTLDEVQGKSCTRKQKKTDKYCAGKGLSHLQASTYHYGKQIACESAAAAGCIPKTPEPEQLARLIDMMAHEMLGWTPGVRGGIRQCLVRKFGLWVGFPVNPYKARITANKFGETTNMEREVNPVVSFGIAFAPNATISGLAGVTYSRVSLPTMVATQQNDAGFWTFTFGIGGNLDIINAFRR